MAKLIRRETKGDYIAETFELSPADYGSATAPPADTTNKRPAGKRAAVTAAGLRFVPQVGNECEIATASMLSGLPYAAARAACPPFKNLGVYGRGLTVAMFCDYLGAVTGQPWQAIKQHRRHLDRLTLPKQPGALLIRTATGGGHYIAYAGQMIFDPAEDGEIPLADYENAGRPVIYRFERVEKGGRK